jgi:Condensation domain
MTLANSDPATTPLIPCRKTSDPYPLSSAQQRLWLFDQLEPGSPLYNIVRAVDLRGQLDPCALRAALDDVVARHEVLRTTLHAVEGHPVQVITPASSVNLPIVDLEADAARSDPDAVHTLLVEEGRRPFDLSRDLMLRAKLFRLHAEEHILLLTMHHIAFDGSSLALLFEELSEGYAAHASGRRLILPGLRIQYADYALWQAEWLCGPRLEGEFTYWKQQLAGLAPLELPTDRPRPVHQTFQGCREVFRLPDEVTSALKLLAGQERVTLFMILLATFQTFLHRYTGQTDIAVGSPIAGRTHAELEGLIGFFVNTLVLRTDLSGDPTFRELLARVREVALGAYDHQDLPFEKLVAEIHPPRTLSHTPLFQTMIALDNSPTASLAFPGITARVTEIETATAHCDLSLLLDTGQAVTGSIEYSTDLFDAATIMRMLGHFETLLRGIAADPGRKLSTLPLMSAPERRQILVEWNNTRPRLSG